MGRRINKTQERALWTKFLEEGEVDSTAAGTNKFNAVKTKMNGRIFHSASESERAKDLQWQLHLGLISDLKYQVKFEVIPKQNGESAAFYYADFTYYDENGKYIVEDWKGHRTADYILKRKLMLLVHGIRILETGKRSKKPHRPRYRKPASKS